MKSAVTVCILFFTLTFMVNAQYEFTKIEDSLTVLGKSIRDGETDFIKYDANEKFLSLLESALLKENSFKHPFDSLTMIARLTAPDNAFRLFNWNLKKADGTFEYFGFVQAWNKSKKKFMIYRLTDKSDEIKNPETSSLDNTNWFGAHYYKIICEKNSGKKYYTLLGWDGNNKITQKKIIDVISFTPSGKMVFGAPIFKYNKKNYKRIIFEYSASTSMSLKYEKQYLLNGKKKRRMIVFDRISPLNNELTGIYQFYYPETNVFDAFLYKNGKWLMVKDIDARNPKMKQKGRISTDEKPFYSPK